LNGYADQYDVSGKTAPRLIRDLLNYDAREPRQIGKNILIDPPALYREGEPYAPRTLSNDCPHQLQRKDLQTFPPAVGERPSVASKYISASYCARCLCHFDVIADFTRRPGRDTPCELGTLFPLHHLQYIRTKKRTESKKEKINKKYDNFKEIHTFTCSNPACPVVVDIRISPPRLNKERLASLWDPAKVFKRGQKAIKDQPERYQDNRPLTPIEVLSVLRTYLGDALNINPAEKKRIAVRNKRFLLAFSDECDDIFEYLEFVLQLEPSGDGVSLFLQRVGRFYLLHICVLDLMS
jgi:ubiquitin carboxyl-terminal hydrolase 25/28